MNDADWHWEDGKPKNHKLRPKRPKGQTEIGQFEGDS